MSTIQSIPMSESDLIVRRIKDGTVIDHIEAGKGLKVLNALEIDGKDGNVITIALNVPSAKVSKKDIIKVENRFLKDDDTNKLALIAPKATVNIIKDYKLVEKRRVALPNEIERIFRCSNPDCITNSGEDIESIMDVVDKTGLVLRCRYCTRILDVNELKYY
jgi:aspartate carbamoyltransferase regulatory subunit